MSHLEGHTGAAKIVKPTLRLRVDQCRAIGLFSRDLVVIENNDIGSALSYNGDLTRGVGPAVHGNKKLGRVFLETAVNSRWTQPISFLGAKWKKAVHSRATPCEYALKKRKRGNPVHIIVTIEDDSFAGLDGATDTADGWLHLRQKKGIFELAKARLEKTRSRIEVSEPVANQDPRNKIGDTELPAEAAGGEIPVLGGKDPSPLHLRDSKASADCINHAIRAGKDLLRD
jgi:hypothetical protein